MNNLQATSEAKDRKLEEKKIKQREYMRRYRQIPRVKQKEREQRRNKQNDEEFKKAKREYIRKWRERKKQEMKIIEQNIQDAVEKRYMQ